MITSHIEDLKAAYVIFFCYLFFFFLNISVSAEFGIAKPFPPLDNYPVELESFEITCIAYDPAGVVVPQKIEFIRTDIYDTDRVVMENGRIEFTNRSAGKESKLLSKPLVKIKWHLNYCVGAFPGFSRVKVLGVFLG